MSFRNIGHLTNNHYFMFTSIMVFIALAWSISGVIVPTGYPQSIVEVLLAAIGLFAVLSYPPPMPNVKY